MAIKVQLEVQEYFRMIRINFHQEPLWSVWFSNTYGFHFKCDMIILEVVDGCKRFIVGIDKIKEN